MANLSKHQQITGTDQDFGLVIKNVFGPGFNRSFCCIWQSRVQTLERWQRDRPLSVQPIWTPNDIEALNTFLGVYWFCVSQDFLLYLAKPSAIINHYAPVEKDVMTDKGIKEHLTLTSTLTMADDHDLWPWPWSKLKDLEMWRQNTVFGAPFDLDLWPTTLTNKPNLAKVKVNHAKNQGCMSNGSSVRALTDRQM